MPTFKSKFEAEVWKELRKHYKSVQYEPDKHNYIQPEIYRKYIPDFKMARNIYIEAKGKLDLATRQKMVWFKESNPHITIIFLFMNANNKITKRSKTTYAEWAEKNGFLWLDYRSNWIDDYKKFKKK
jgi:2'-5' RNA ligase